MLWVTALKARGSTSRSGPAVPQARAGSECLRVLGVQALASPQSGRFADVSSDTTRSRRPSFWFPADAGPFGVWQLLDKVLLLPGATRPRLESSHTSLHFGFGSVARSQQICQSGNFVEVAIQFAAVLAKMGLDTEHA